MKRILRQIIFLLIAICIVTYVLDDQSTSHRPISPNKECSDLAGHFEDSHLNHFDDVSYIEPDIQSNKYMNQPELLIIPCVGSYNHYQSFVWQPPKRS